MHYIAKLASQSLKTRSAKQELSVEAHPDSLELTLKERVVKVDLK